MSFVCKNFQKLQGTAFMVITCCDTFGTAAWKIKSVYALADIFVKVAWITVTCGFPGGFVKLNVIFKAPFWKAVMVGIAGFSAAV